METPVLVGVAQLNQRSDAAGQPKEPIELMIDASRMAAADADAPALLAQATSVRVVRGWWPYKNPARVVREAVGAPEAETGLTPYGGNFVQSTVNKSALDIQAGKHELILITGAECGNSRAKTLRAGKQVNWRDIDGTPDVYLGEDVMMVNDVEKALRLTRPIRMYPLLEVARRHHVGEGVQDHLKRISELWAGFSAVAADNPHAWLREAKTAEEIRTASAVNRPVSFPYPKFMNSNDKVDQAAALILCSARKAAALGIPKEKWIYPWVGTDAHDHYYVSNRDNLHSSPAIRIAGGRALELAGLSPDDLHLVDLYSCFPIAVQVAAAELKLGTDRPLTVTGGLTFAGGPLNNYVMHSIARMAELLRESPTHKGLITANGGYITKHAFGIYAAEPPSKPFQYANPQEEVDALPARPLATDHNGQAEVEGYSVIYGAQGPEQAHVAARLAGGERTWANCEDLDVMQAMTEQEFCGRAVTVAGGVAHF